MIVTDLQLDELSPTMSLAEGTGTSTSGGRHRALQTRTWPAIWREFGETSSIAGVRQIAEDTPFTTRRSVLLLPLVYIAVSAGNGPVSVGSYCSSGPEPNHIYHLWQYFNFLSLHIPYCPKCVSNLPGDSRWR